MRMKLYDGSMLETLIGVCSCHCTPGIDVLASIYSGISWWPLVSCREIAEVCVLDGN